MRRPAPHGHVRAREPAPPARPPGPAPPRVNPPPRLAAWVRLLALTAAHPERPFEALTVGRAPSGSDARVTIARIPPLDADPAARRALALAPPAVLVALL